MTEEPLDDRNSKAHSQHTADRKTFNLYAVLLVMSVISMLVCSGFTFREPTTDRVLSLVLIALSSMYLFSVSLLHRGSRDNLGSLLIPILLFEVAKCVLFILYDHAFSGQYVSSMTSQGKLGSIAALICMAGLVSGAVYWISHMVWFPQNGHPLLKAMSHHRFLALMSFLALLLYALYFLTFALAFHDRGTHGGGLYAEPLPKPSENQPNQNLYVDEVIDTDDADDQDHCQDKISKDDAIGTILFREGQASIGCAQALLRRAKWNPSQSISRETLTGFHDDTSECEGHIDEAKDVHNALVLQCISQKLSAYTEYQRLRLTLMGHANDKKPDRQRYPSNYELSRVRVEQVRVALSNLIDMIDPSPNIEWLLSPVSSERIFLSSGYSPQATDDERSLSVEVSVHGVRNHMTEVEMVDIKHRSERNRERQQLTLLDYLYFMIYTITTTGYGDLVPRSPLAKFITSIANLFEVFFLVVTIPMLLALFGKNGK